MQRRGFLRGLVALAAGAVGAGCTNNREVPATAPELPVTGTPSEGAGDGNGGDDPVDGGDGPTVTTTKPDDGGATSTGTYAHRTETPRPLVNGGFELVEESDGTLLVEVTVRNRTERDRTATVSVRLAVDDEEYAETDVDTVDRDDTRTFRFYFPVAYDAFVAEPSIDVSIRQGTPETPLPTETPTPTATATHTATPTTPDGSDAT